MKKTLWGLVASLAWLGGVAACGNSVETDGDGTTTAKYEVSPEVVCADWVANACQALGGCCTGADKFDQQACEIQLSYGCLQSLNPELIRAGVIEYDEAAAKKCFSQDLSCDISAEPDEEVVAACRKMVTGHREPGTPCDSAQQCKPAAGGYATCYSADYIGLCATVFESDNGTCGFSIDDYTLYTCPEGTYCDTSQKTIPPDASPTEAAYAFTAPCKAYLGVGEICYSSGSDQILQCASGLYCNFYDAMSPDEVTCAQAKGAGQPCSDNSQCAAGLECAYDTQTCAAVSGPFCFGPAVCGNSYCEPQETEVSCPDDCGGYCGDGYCTGDEYDYCYEDCGETPYCGDGYCDGGEDGQSCPEDCGYCGDGYCSFDEDPYACPEDCGYCGDGYCGPDESSASCPDDCGSACQTCGEYISDGSGELCQGVSEALYSALVSCVCEGACQAVCGANLCAGMSPDADCQTCVLDTAAGCGNEYQECANDF